MPIENKQQWAEQKGKKRRMAAQYIRLKHKQVFSAHKWDIRDKKRKGEKGRRKRQTTFICLFASMAAKANLKWETKSTTTTLMTDSCQIQQSLRMCHPICNKLEHVSCKRKTILRQSKLHKGQTEHYGFILRLINLIMSLYARATTTTITRNSRGIRNSKKVATNCAAGVIVVVETATAKRHANQ